MTEIKPDLTLGEFAGLVARRSVIYFERARICVRFVLDPNGIAERRFVMEGPSGTHSLLVDATDPERLNAHWRIFATDARNRHR